MSNLSVVAVITVKPGSEQIVEAALQALAAASRGDHGCVSYELFASASAPATFVTVEEWESQEDIDAHMDTSTGELVLDVGHLENPDLKVTVDYDTAKAILIEGNPQAGMQAFMAGKIKVEGDMAKLLALQAAPVGADSSAAEMANRLREITA